MIRGSLKWAVWCATAAALAGCGGAPKHTHGVSSSPMAESHGYYKVGKPYQIDGVWYYPKEDWSYDETGIASWYGEQFHGRYTADGEVFDLNSLTAAHRTLPMPSVVTVTNLDNGRSIKLRVNDRGPYARGRIIDVSRRAAQMLGFEGAGTAKVRVTIDAEDSMKVAAAAGRGGSAPTPAAMVAAIASAPMTLPVSALEAMRGGRQPELIPTAEPTPRPTEVRVADNRPMSPPPSASPPQTRIADAKPLPPPPAEVRIADIRPMAVAPPPRPASQSRPAPMPAARPVASDRPYIIDDLPGEETAAMAPPPSSPPMPSHVDIVPVKSTQIYVQAGAFADQGNALRLQSRLRALGSRVSVTAAVTGSGTSVYRVRVGPIPSVDAADDMLNRVVSDGVAEARIVVD